MKSLRSRITVLTLTLAIHSCASDFVQVSKTQFAGTTGNYPSEVYLSKRTEDSGHTGISRRVSLPIHAELGQGYSLLAGTLRGYSVTNDNAVVNDDNENAVTYDLNYIDSYKKLAESMNLSVRASYKGVGGGASASMDLFQSVNYSSNNAYILVNMRVINGTSSLNSYSLNSYALKLLSTPEGPNEFSNKYGNTFVSRLVKGAELYALLEYSTSSLQEVEKLKLSVSGSVGAFSASANLSKKIEKLTKNKNVKIYYSQVGGGVGRQLVPKTPKGGDYVKGGVLALTPGELLSRIREFPSEVRTKSGKDAAAVLWGEVIDYQVTRNLPDSISIPTYIKTSWTLDDLGAAKLLVDQMGNDASFVLINRIGFTPDDIALAKSVLKYTSFVSEQMGRLNEAVVSYPEQYMLLSQSILPSFADFQYANGQLEDNGTIIKQTKSSRSIGKKAKSPLLLLSNKFSPLIGETCENYYSDDVACDSPSVSCAAALPNEHSVIKCLVGSGVVYSTPQKHTISLDGWQVSSRSFWSKGKKHRDYNCPTKVPSGYVLVNDIQDDREHVFGNRYKVFAICLDQAGPDCNSHGEYCANRYFVNGCYVNKAWHNWYESNITNKGGVYDYRFVCG